VRKAQWWSTWVTTTAYFAKIAGVIFCPHSRQAPVVFPPGASKVKLLSKLVLPAPLGPKIPSTWPLETDPLMFLMMVLDLLLLLPTV